MLNIAVALLLVGLGIMVKLLTDWFTSLNADSEFQLADLAFEDPSSIKKIPAPSVFSEPSKSLSIVIPAYNEEDRLPATLTETLAYLQRRRDRQGAAFTYEVVIVDDGSSDSTAATAFDSVRKHGSDAVRVLRLPRNRGKGYAVKAGVLCSRGQNVLFMDADGATKVSEVERLEKKLKEVLENSNNNNNNNNNAGGVGNSSDGVGNSATVVPFGSMGVTVAAAAASPSSVYTSNGGFGQLQSSSSQQQQQLRQIVPSHAVPAFVLGSRAHLQESAMAKRTWIRNFLMHGFHFLVTLVVGHNIRDTQCGFKLLTRSAAQQLVPNQRLQRWAFDVELVYIAQRLRVPMAEVQVTWTEIPGSKVRLTSIAHIAFELAMIKLGYTMGAWRVKAPNEITPKSSTASGKKQGKKLL